MSEELRHVHTNECLDKEQGHDHEVEALIPPSHRERKNKNGLTPHELFMEEHKDLLSANEKWMKDTANQCLVVGALIASIAFAAVFGVPGGYNTTRTLAFPCSFIINLS